MYERLSVALSTILAILGGLGVTYLDLDDERAGLNHPAVSMPVTEPYAPFAAIAQTGRSADGLFRIPVDIDGHTVQMIVDTGASVTIIAQPVLQQMRNNVDLTGEPVSTIRTLNGSTQYRHVTVGSLRIGSHIIENPQLAVIDGDQPVSVIGQDILRRLGTITIAGDTITIG